MSTALNISSSRIMLTARTLSHASVAGSVSRNRDHRLSAPLVADWGNERLIACSLSKKRRAIPGYDRRIPSDKTTAFRAFRQSASRGGSAPEAAGYMVSADTGARCGFDNNGRDPH